jgi:hypothetical protein
MNEYDWTLCLLREPFRDRRGENDRLKELEHGSASPPLGSSGSPAVLAGEHRVATPNDVTTSAGQAIIIDVPEMNPGRCRDTAKVSCDNKCRRRVSRNLLDIVLRR